MDILISPAKKADKKIRVAVVGVGYLGKIHARIYRQMADVQLLAVVDTQAEVAQAVAEECQCEAYTTIESLVDKIDAVSIVVPTSLHAQIARPFLEAGIPTLLEKPIAPSYEESLTIVALAEKNNTLLQIGHLERFNAGVIALGKRIQNPRFIESHRISGFVARATDVDVVTDLMIHDIDIVLSLVKSKIRAVSAAGTPVLTQHIDIANARLEFMNGAVANLTASRVSDKKLRRIRIFEEQRYEALDFVKQQLEVVTTQPATAEDQWPKIVREQVEIVPQQPLDAELACFIRSVQTGEPPLVTGRVGLEALEVALQVRAKIEENRILGQGYSA